MEKFKVVITDREYETVDAERQILEEAGIELKDYQLREGPEFLEAIKDADGIIVQYAKMPREVIEQLTNCKIIARYATGFDGIDTEAAAEHGIYVCNVPDYCGDEVSSHAIALLMELARRVDKYNQWTHSGNWYAMPGKQHNLREQTIGVISFGKIARQYVEKLKPFCDNIWVYDAFVPDQAIEDFGVTPKSFEEILENADYISIHCPLTEDTRHMFNKETFKKMKNTAKIINVARGPVVSQEDLVWAIENGEIGGAALDVLEQEPPEANNPLFNYDNIIITPHTAWYSVESQLRLQQTPAREVVRVLKGEEPLNSVNSPIKK